MAEPMRRPDGSGDAVKQNPERSARRSKRRKHRHWNRRKRRLRTAALALAVVAVVGAVAGVWIYRATRPEAYTPGAETEGITRNLERGLPAEAPEPKLVDVTEEAGLAGFRSFAGTRSSQLPEDMGAGLAWGDWDGDGDDDLFAVAAGGPLTEPSETWAESVLYENVTTETSGLAFRRSDAFPGARIVGMGAAWGDYTGDGHLDLALSGYETLHLYRNLGPEEGYRLVLDERFPPAGLDTDRYWAGLAWGDYDLDRDLDLYVTGYVRYEEDPNAREQVTRQYGHAVPYTLNPVSYEPEVNLLLRNDGGTFTEVAEELGVANDAGRSLGALWRDFDDDGRLDLYVANDVSDNALYRGVGQAAGEGEFEDIGLAAWVADYRGAMGLAAGDWNRDGDDDLFVTHWVAQENALYDNLLADQAAKVEAGTGPALPAGIGFSDLAAPLGLGQVALRFVGWGTELADLDGDGWLDLLVVNGSTFEQPEDHTRLAPQEPLLLWNRGGEHFHDLAPLAPALAEPHVGRGMAMADADGDGDLDVAIHHWGEGIQLLRNDMQSGRSVELALRSRGPDGELTGRGDGAVVMAKVVDPDAGEDGETIHRRGVTGASYLSQSSATVHIGLGRSERLDEVEVRWLGGGTDTWRNLDAGARWQLTEGDPVPRRVATFPVANPGEAYTVRERSAGESAARGPAGAPSAGDAGPGELTERERIARFWQLQRAGMDAIKVDGDPAKAAGFFRQALELDPEHEDAHYYLAAAQVSLGETDEALEHLRRLTEINPQSHRGHKRWGTLRALTAENDEHLEQAAAALERSLELNKEETGALLVLAEIDLLRGDVERARQHLEWATRTNPRAVGGQFLRGYLAWKAGDASEARERLEAAREGLGPDWVPEGAVAEGDTEETMHVEDSPLARFWRRWDGEPRPDTAYAALDGFLEG